MIYVLPVVLVILIIVFGYITGWNTKILRLLLDHIFGFIVVSVVLLVFIISMIRTFTSI